MTAMEKLNRALGHEGMDRCSATDALAAWKELTMTERRRILPGLSDREKALIGIVISDKLKATVERVAAQGKRGNRE